MPETVVGVTPRYPARARSRSYASGSRHHASGVRRPSGEARPFAVYILPRPLLDEVGRILRQAPKQTHGLRTEHGLVPYVRMVRCVAEGVSPSIEGLFRRGLCWLCLYPAVHYRSHCVPGWRRFVRPSLILVKAAGMRVPLDPRVGDRCDGRCYKVADDTICDYVRRGV